MIKNHACFAYLPCPLYGVTLRLPQNRFLCPPGRRYRRSGEWSTPASEGGRPAATSTPHLPSRSEIDIQRSTLRWTLSPPWCNFVQTPCVVVTGDNAANLADHGVMGRQRRSLLGRDLIRASRVVRRDGGGGGVLLQEGCVAFAPHGAD